MKDQETMQLKKKVREQGDVAFPVGAVVGSKIRADVKANGRCRKITHRLVGYFLLSNWLYSRPSGVKWPENSRS